MTIAVLIYAIGGLVALLRSDAPPLVRLPLAVLWPAGPAAFALTVGLLLFASLIAFPIAGIVVLGAALLAGWALL